LTDTAILLLILEGVPFLALVYYLMHRKQMLMLEKGIEERDDRCVRAERRMTNGLFLTLGGICMILAPQIASIAGLEAELSFEFLLAGLIVLCAGLAMLIGCGLIKYRPDLFEDRDRSADMK